MSTNEALKANVSDSGRVHFKVGKSLCGETFLGKNGMEYREIKLPNEDPADKSSWATFIVGANQVHLDKFSEGRLNTISIREDSDITLKKSIITGRDEEGKNIYGSMEFKISAKDLKQRYDSMRGSYKEQHETKEEKPSVTEKLTELKEKVETKESKEPKSQTKKKEQMAI